MLLMSSTVAKPPDDARLDTLHAWVRARCDSVIDITPVSTDASFRRYFRVHCPDRTCIVMDAPPAQEDCRPFIDVAARLAACDVHVPEILESDLDLGFLLLSDLGRQSYLDTLTAENAEALYADAMATLVRFQARADVTGLPVYDADRLRQELQLFPDWYLGRHLGSELDPVARSDLDAVFDRLIEHALAQPRVFVHRDYMPRNLMVTQPNPGVIDFQDAVLGPISYDVVSLLKDAFISWPEQRVTDWIGGYWRTAREQGLPLPDSLADFLADCDWMGLQRHLKVLGIFARIRYRDGKPHYLADAPRFVNYIMTTAARYPELASLTDLFRARVLPSLES